MFKNYFKTSFRFLLKSKGFSLINIIGLALGTLCCLYILVYVADQYSYDKHHRGARDIYRVTTRLGMKGAKLNLGTASPPVAAAMKHDFAEVAEFARVIPTQMFGVKEHLLRYRDKSFYESDAVFADSTFFQVFSWQFLEGNPRDALRDPYSVVLMRGSADKLFGSEDPLGKVITIDNSYGKHDFRVTGVVDESLGKSHIHANLFMTMNSGGMGEYTHKDLNWVGDNFVSSYVRLDPRANLALLEKKLPAFLDKYGGEDLKNSGMHKELHLQPIGEIHTAAGYENGMGEPVNRSLLYILLLIAVLIQVIACINFMNLSTARASKRAKEVGVRKVVGALKKDLVSQFLGESLFITLIAVVLALILLWALFPLLNHMTEAKISFSFLLNWRTGLLLALFILLTSGVAGSYPAFYLSAFRTIKVLKGNFTNQVSALGIRRSLVVFQFVLSIALIGAIIIIYSQLNYIKNKDLGFQKDQTLVFTFHTHETRAQMPAFTSDLRQLPEVKQVSKASNYPSQFIINDFPVFMAGGSMASALDVQFLVTDEWFVQTAGIQLISGRDFRQYDSGKVLINETLARDLGLKPEKAIGTILYPDKCEVAGVMKDFNYNSLHAAIRPFMLRYGPDGIPGWDIDLPVLMVSTNATSYHALLDKINAIWKKDFPQTPFEYAFLDQEVQKQYEAETTLSRIINLFTGMAVLISCLGLFGLAAFSAEQRAKELGIRKVLGASALSLTGLLSMDFLKLVGVAFLIAVPVSGWAMHLWLQQFAYRVSLSWWMFALSGLLGILIALITVSFQSIRAAIGSPVKALKSE
jgi:putative ABC transport system permease protein